MFNKTDYEMTFKAVKGKMQRKKREETRMSDAQRAKTHAVGWREGTDWGRHRIERTIHLQKREARKRRRV